MAKYISGIAFVAIIAISVSCIISEVHAIEGGGNPCSPDPCQNGGNCVLESGITRGYVCQCTGDFVGINCEFCR